MKTWPLYVLMLVLGSSNVPAQGLRTLESRYLKLHTDLPPSNEVDQLPHWFDQAVEAWRNELGVRPRDQSPWQAEGCLMEHADRFVAAGLMPADLPKFLNGRNVGSRFWMNEQPHDYYRRHLLLHEGVHCWMEHCYGGPGPNWYWEGMAELLATHRIVNGRLMPAIFPKDRAEVPWLGRIKIIQDALKDQAPQSLEQVLTKRSNDFLDNQAYGWSWGLAELLEHHPRYHQSFHDLRQLIQHPDFNRAFSQSLGANALRLRMEWDAYIALIEHGYDFERTEIDFQPGTPLTAPRKVSIAADRGWQSSGVHVEQGSTCHLAASGRFTLRQQPQPWPCEAGGITIEYYQGQPLGKLLATILPDEPQPSDHPFLHPFPIGLSPRLAPAASGTLYLRINDRASELSDNAGQLQLELSP